jgi:membrane-associated HD superfamily phosphohydrolase
MSRRNPLVLPDPDLEDTGIGKFLIKHDAEAFLEASKEWDLIVKTGRCSEIHKLWEVIKLLPLSDRRKEARAVIHKVSKNIEIQKFKSQQQQVLIQQEVLIADQKYQVYLAQKNRELREEFFAITADIIILIVAILVMNWVVKKFDLTLKKIVVGLFSIGFLTTCCWIVNHAVQELQLEEYLGPVLGVFGLATATRLFHLSGIRIPKF